MVTKIEYVKWLGYNLFIFLQGCSLVALLYCTSNVKTLQCL
jgi:hypothetical protein